MSTPARLPLLTESERGLNLASCTAVTFEIFIIVIGAFFVLYALYAGVGSLWRLAGQRRLCGFIGGVLIAYGGAAFFGCALSASGSLPATIQWPIGHADQLMQTTDGRRIAGHPASGRIQVYDHEWKFLVGWLVPAGGGDFKARLLPDNTLEVWTARGGRHFLFTLDGTQMEASSYPLADYPRISGLAGGGYVPTPLVLWPFSDPPTAWGVAVVGGLLLWYSDPQRFRKGRSVSIQRS